MSDRIFSERGQALILLVFAVVGLLGFTALAVDGGRLYADRRFAQNGADAASLAGGGAAAGWLKLKSDSGVTGVNGEDWDCDSPAIAYASNGAMEKAVEEAIQNAKLNDFDITYSPTFNANGNIVAINCEEVNGHYIDVRVSITYDTQTSFVHFVYQGVTRNTVDAITRVFPREPVGAGYSIISLTDDCSGSDKGTRFSGTSDIYLGGGGGVFSNSCIVSDGSSGTVHISGDGSYDESFTYDPHGSPIIDPTPHSVDYEYKPTIDPPGCPGIENPTPVSSGSNTTYSPGHYTTDIRISGGGPVTPTVNLNSGLYCFTNGAGFKVTGSNLYGTDVTLFFRTDAGGFDTTGNGEVQLYAPIEPCSSPLAVDCSPAVPNLLIYMEDGNASGITLGGNSTSYYEGTIYAPSGQVAVGGASSELTNVGVQVIANSVRVHGTVTMTINYDDSKIYHTPNILNFEK